MCKRGFTLIEMLVVMGIIAVLTGSLIVGFGRISKTAQLLRQREIAVGAQLSGPCHAYRLSVFRIQTQQMLALTVGCAGKMQSAVEIVEHKAFVRELVEGGGELLTDAVARKTFHCEEHYVVVLEDTCIFILLCRCY